MTISSKVFSEEAYKRAILSVDKIKKKLPSDEAVLKVAQLKYPSYKIESNIDALAIMIFGFMKSMKVPEEIGKDFNKTRNEIEGKEKVEAIEDSLDTNRNQHKCFYLCSKHNDCAKDHLNYQGRIYIDEKWQDYVGKDTKPKVQEYIDTHNTMTLQEVTHRPVWLITRPHCRHYFKALWTSEVLENSVKDLIKKNNMTKKIGDRQFLQTMDSGVGTYKRRLLGEKRNAQLMMEKYQNRLETYTKLYKIKKTPILKDAINKTRFMVAKWKKYYNEL